MADVNLEYVGHEGCTDVITFRYFPEPGEVGEPFVAVEILLCPETAFRESQQRRIPYSRELVLYLVHGLLHASGEDDTDPVSRRRMRRRERSVIRQLGKTFDLDNLFPEPFGSA
jgi:probable rRNA maturation factor